MANDKNGCKTWIYEDRAVKVCAQAGTGRGLEHNNLRFYGIFQKNGENQKFL